MLSSLSGLLGKRKKRGGKNEEIHLHMKRTLNERTIVPPHHLSCGKITGGNQKYHLTGAVIPTEKKEFGQLDKRRGTDRTELFWGVGRIG